MSNPKGNPSTAFKPGHNIKSPGRPPGPGLPPEVVRLKNTAKSESIRAVAECLLMDKEQLKAMMEDPQSNMAQLITGSVILNAIKKGDIYRFGLLLNYVMGKPKPVNHPWNEEIKDDDPEAEQRAAVHRIPTAMLLAAMKAQTDAKP